MSNNEENLNKPSPSVFPSVSLCLSTITSWSFCFSSSLMPRLFTERGWGEKNGDFNLFHSRYFYLLHLNCVLTVTKTTKKMQLNVFWGGWHQDLHFPGFLSSRLYVVVKGLVQLTIAELRLCKGTSPQILALFSHLGPNMTISQHAQIPLQLLLHYQSATGLNNNVLSPQACNNTCWRDQQLANVSNNQGPRVLFYAENRPKVLFNTDSANPTQIPPNLTLPFFFFFVLPACILPFAQCSFYLSIALSPSLLGHFDAEKTGFCGCGKLRPAYEVWDKYPVHQGQCQGLNASQLCGIGSPMACVHAYVSSCLYSWALTGMLAHDNGTDVYSPLMHYSRKMTPPSQEI